MPLEETRVFCDAGIKYMFFQNGKRREAQPMGCPNLLDVVLNVVILAVRCTDVSKNADILHNTATNIIMFLGNVP